MKNHLRLVASNDATNSQPLRFNRERLSAFGKGALPFFAVPLHALRHVLYVLMLFIRIPVRLVCRLTLVPLLIAAGVWGAFKGWTSAPTLMLTGAAFALFVVSFLYDTLLMIVAPEQIALDS